MLETEYSQIDLMNTEDGCISVGDTKPLPIGNFFEVRSDPGSMINTSISIEISKSRIRNSTVVGALTYVVGFLLAFVTTSSGSKSSYREAFPTVVEAGFKFYNAHLTDHVERRDAEAVPRNQLLDSIFAEYPVNEQVAVLWLLIPVVLLLLAGALSTMVSEHANTETDVVTGSLIALGYFPLIVFGARLIRYRGSAFIHIIDLSTAAGVGGLAYPVVFGGLGGYVYHKLLRRPAFSV
jgi:uncharacterized membrane protein